MPLYPTDLPLRSILEPLPIGTHPLPDVGDELAAISIHENVLITGGPGTGATDVLLSVTAGLLQCAGVLVWGIDNADQVLRPFTSPKADGKRSIDWLATTSTEALLLVAAAQQVIDTRIAAPDQPLPPIVVVVPRNRVNNSDMYQVNRDLVRIARTGPAVDVYLVYQTDSVKQDGFQPDMLPYVDARVVMNPAGVSELIATFGTHPKAWVNFNLATVAQPGEGVYVSDRDAPPRVLEAFQVTSARAEQIAADTSERRPHHLDTLSLAAISKSYISRWQRTDRDTAFQVGTRKPAIEPATMLPLFLFSEIAAAGAAGQRADTLLEAANTAGYATTQAEVIQILEDAADAGTVARHPLDAGWYVDPTKRQPQEILSINQPVRLTTLTRMLESLAAEHANDDGYDGQPLTTDHLALVTDGRGRRIVVYDMPVQPQAQRGKRPILKNDQHPG